MRYLPPEYFGEHAAELVTKEGDVYSMGMTIYEVKHNTATCITRLLSFFQVLTDKKPFHDVTSLSVGMAVLNGERPKKPNFKISRGYTKELWKLTEDCWDADPSKRITIENLAKGFESEVSKWRPRKK